MRLNAGSDGFLLSISVRRRVDGPSVNIAIFTESFRPYVNGVAVSVASFTRQLRGLGDAVDIFTPAMPGYEDEDPRVHRYPAVRFRSRRLQYEPDYTLAVGRFPGLPLLLRTAFDVSLHNLEQRPHLDAMLRDMPIDVIHTQSPFAMGAEGRRWARRRGVPLVTTFHTLYTEYTHYTPFVPRAISLPAILHWTRRNCNAADIVIAPTEAAREVLRQWGVRRPVSILATGIDTAQFQNGDGAAIRKRWEIPANAQTLLYAGRVAPEKNIPLLLDAFEAVLAARPDAILLFAGGGPDLEAVRALTERRFGPDRTRFAGYVAREEMRDYYSAADILTFPSSTETQGLVLCEAMAAGLPFVAVESPGGRSVIPAGYEEYLIPPDAATMASLALRLTTDPEERRRLVDLGRTAAEAFSEEAAGRKLRSIYEEAIASRRA